MLSDRSSATIRLLRAQARGSDDASKAVAATRPCTHAVAVVAANRPGVATASPVALSPGGTAVDDCDRSTLELISRLRAHTGRPRAGLGSRVGSALGAVARPPAACGPEFNRQRASSNHQASVPVVAPMTAGTAVEVEGWREVLDRLLRHRGRAQALRSVIEPASAPELDRVAAAPQATDEPSSRAPGQPSDPPTAGRTPAAVGVVDGAVVQAQAAVGSRSSALHAFSSRVVLHHRPSSPLPGVEVGELLFLDLETSGLSVGHGPFCAGVASFAGDQLDVEQWLLASPAAEPALISCLADRIAACPVLVTYNGASFDWPLLRARARLWGIAMPALKAHYDLLPRVRRLFAKQWPQYRLVDVEQRLLGRIRIADLPSAQVPTCWRRYLATGQRAVLEPVVEHNRIDLESLAHLWMALVERQGLATPAVSRRRKQTALAA